MEEEIEPVKPLTQAALKVYQPSISETECQQQHEVTLLEGMENASLLADPEPLKHRQHFFPGNLPFLGGLSSGYLLLIGDPLIILNSWLHCIKVTFLYLHPTLE